MMMTSTVTNINNTWDYCSWILSLTGNGGDDEYDDGDNIKGDDDKDDEDDDNIKGDDDDDDDDDE